MDDSLDPYVRFSDKDRCPNTPALEVSLYAPQKFYTEIPDEHFFTLTLKRLPDREGPKEKQQPCRLSWSPSTDKPEEFLLFHSQYHGGFKKIEVENTLPIHQPELPHLWSLGANGSSSWKMKMGSALYQSLKPGKLYELFWPGCEVHLWDWGTNETHLGENLMSRSAPVILPGGVCCSFTLLEGVPPPRRWSAPIIESNMGAPGAPILSLKIDAPPTWKVEDDMQVTYKVTYQGVLGEDAARPITFYTPSFDVDDAFGVYWRRRGTDKWESWHTVAPPGYPAYPEEDRQVNVGTPESGFVSLQPHETWTWVADLACEYDLPENARVGEAIRYRFKGCQLEWWDWGTKDDHMDTVLTVPGLWGVGVLEPPDNGGRPKARVPASNTVEFTVIG